jgi:Na+(H+)/acetate symporter ActP
MIYQVSPIAIGIFIVFVLAVLGLSFYFARKAKSASGYYAAGGQIHWGVNGIAFAGDYLSAASFLGIAGMIAFYGYDGFLYSIGYLAGWVVALFLVAEPLRRLGKYTFADALDAKFNSSAIKLTAAILMLLFWKKTTSNGISWAIVVGTLTSLGIILLSPTLFEIYGLNPQDAPIPLQNPGIISIPLGFITLIIVSLMTQRKKAAA